jgi:hypothetical protein
LTPEGTPLDVQEIKGKTLFRPEEMEQRKPSPRRDIKIRNKTRDKERKPRSSIVKERATGTYPIVQNITKKIWREKDP